MSNNEVVAENNLGNLKEKRGRNSSDDKRHRKKKKEITESIGRLKFEMEENRRKIAETEKENYQAEARLRELKGYLVRLNLEEDKVRLRNG